MDRFHVGLHHNLGVALHIAVFRQDFPNDRKPDMVGNIRRARSKLDLLVDGSGICAVKTARTNPQQWTAINLGLICSVLFCYTFFSSDLSI